MTDDQRQRNQRLLREGHNGEYATSGIGDTSITAETTYGLTLTKG